MSEAKKNLHDLLADLAAARRAVSAQAHEVAMQKNKAEATVEFKTYDAASEEENRLADEVAKLDTTCRALALKDAKRRKNKKPAPGANVTAKTTFEILNTAAAIEYCRQSMHVGLGLNKKIFRGQMLDLPEESRPDCVQVTTNEYGAVKIDTNLDPLYPALPALVEASDE